MRNLQQLFIAILLIAISHSVLASGNVNVSISTNCIGQDSFSIILSYTQDCLADTAPTNIYVTVKSTCGDTLQVKLTGSPFYIGMGYPMPCENLLTCVGGWIPSQRNYYYEGRFSFPSPCKEWVVFYERPQRDPLVNALSSSLYVETKVFSFYPYTPQVQPMTSIRTINQPTQVSYGVSSLNNDSLVYSLSSPKNSNQSNILFNIGFSKTQPIPGITINPHTGKCIFKPSYSGEYVIGVTIDAYSRNTGNLTSTTLIDYTVWVMDSINSEPNLSSIQNLQGNAILTNPTTISTQLGDSFSFEIIATDSDIGDSLTFWDDIKSVLPGASVTALHGNPGKLLVSWKAPLSPNETKKFELFVIDDFCLPSMGSKEFTIIVGNGINSTQQLHKDLGIKIYPNPVQELLQIDIGTNQNVNVEILDMKGEILIVKNGISSNQSISLSDFPPGMYLVKITTKSGTYFQKIIKN